MKRESVNLESKEWVYGRAQEEEREEINDVIIYYNVKNKRKMKAIQNSNNVIIVPINFILCVYMSTHF